MWKVLYSKQAGFQDHAAVSLRVHPKFQPFRKHDSGGPLERGLCGECWQPSWRTPLRCCGVWQIIRERVNRDLGTFFRQAPS
ncbi:hypothetical protein Q31a_13450 [Aureliella helgolandensis]|uniref:Uncharacterized protein n=1 Tax=Aureliella helgolandensis TaxID=2527968 RepID=A0A518G3B4_9BACT|nr:hypothetical protein Q31a_13450 [Aureliella helgolandensis]